MPQTPFNPAEIQSKYNKLWQESKIYQTPDYTSTKPKKYILDAFAYPSGVGIHAGHAEGYIATDILARYYRQSGYDVLFPVGFDSFGLPAENYAIKTGVHPRINTDTTIQYYREQVTALGLSNDWADELGTHNEDYYKWTQWFFGLLYSRGLAYKKNALVNWDPVDQTVLANEQVLADGTAERSGAKVEQKMMSQWFFKITDYAERLLSDLDKVNWPESTKLMQKNWIGKSVGAEVDFVISGATPLIKGVRDEVSGGIKYVPYNPKLKDFARDNRSELTETESLVWRNILKEKKTGYTFNRQKPLLEYIADFYCSELRLVIEIDDNSHEYKFGYDQKRSKELAKYGISVIRFSNHDVKANLNGVKLQIEKIICESKVNLPKSFGFDPLYQEGGDQVSTDTLPTYTNPNYLFIHGWEGSSKSNYLPQVKETFDRLGLAIQIPDLPNSANPNVLKQAKYILDNCKIDSNTVIIGHSLGVAVGLKVVEQLDFVITKFVSVAGFVGIGFHTDNLPKGVDDPFDFASFDFDFHKIKNRSRQFVGLWSEDDQYITLEQVSKLESALDFKVDKVSGYKHLNNLSQKIVQDKILDKITVFTTAHDTIFGTSFVVLAPEHELVDSLTTPQHFDEVQAYKQQAKSKSQFERTEMNKDKSGVWTGSYVINPVNGNKIQVWVADYVLTNYGTGAVMGVPGEDERDFEFATKYELPIIYTNNTNSFVSYSQEIKPNKAKYTLINSDKFDSMTYAVARPLILEELVKSACGQPKVTFRLRDWLVSRQRYWGSPIPVVYSNEEEMLVPESDLPVILPNDVEFKPSGRSPLIDHEEFHASAKAKYGSNVRREVDTMDTFVCSSWYMFRFVDPHNQNVFASPEKMSKWGPVDEYVIGAEHCVLHLLYARFFTKVLFDAGYIDFDEPFTKVTHPGIILGSDNRKMSKRWGNVINPMDVVDELGADALRLYVMFMGPFEQSKPWNVNSLRGVKRFLDRVWKMQYLIGTEGLRIENSKLDSALHKLIKKVGDDIVDYSFNTSVAEFMKFVNLVEDVGYIGSEQLLTFLKVLAPFAPYITEQMYQTINEYSPCKGWQSQTKGMFVSQNSIHNQPFPQYDDSKLVESEVTIGVQINGKVRGELTLSPIANENEALVLIQHKDYFVRYLEGKQIQKFIYRPGKIINIIVS